MDFLELIIYFLFSIFKNNYQYFFTCSTWEILYLEVLYLEGQIYQLHFYLGVILLASCPSLKWYTSLCYKDASQKHFFTTILEILLSALGSWLPYFLGPLSSTSLLPFFTSFFSRNQLLLKEEHKGGKFWVLYVWISLYLFILIVSV